MTKTCCTKLTPAFLNVPRNAHTALPWS